MVNKPKYTRRAPHASLSSSLLLLLLCTNSRTPRHSDLTDPTTIIPSYYNRSLLGFNIKLHSRFIKIFIIPFFVFFFSATTFETFFSFLCIYLYHPLSYKNLTVGVFFFFPYRFYSKSRNHAGLKLLIAHTPALHRHVFFERVVGPKEAQTADQRWSPPRSQYQKVSEMSNLLCIHIFLSIGSIFTHSYQKCYFVLVVYVCYMSFNVYQIKYLLMFIFCLHISSAVRI